MRAAAIVVLVLSAAYVVVAPLAGSWIAGKPVAPYLEFPPRTGFVAHAPFDATAFIALCVPLFAAAALYATALRRARSASGTQASHPFPSWGWVGVGLVAAGWVLAWSGLAAGWRRHTFTPLWLGYILVTNALAVRASGKSPLTHRTAWFLLLFPVSALFWWIFEFLNQFVGNWYYEGVEASGDWDYFSQATLPFSSVLPAVAGTWAWIRTLPRIDAMSLPPLRGQPAFAWAALFAGAFGLFAIGVWPEEMFSTLWLAPLLLTAGLQHLAIGETLFSPLARGDWRPVLQPALAALACGFFWEMWNYGSLAKWHYSIPYAQRFHVFEMPLLGYAGYLPFGVHCAVLMDLVARVVERRGAWPLERSAGSTRSNAMMRG